MCGHAAHPLELIQPAEDGPANTENRPQHTIDDCPHSFILASFQERDVVG